MSEDRVTENAEKRLGDDVADEESLDMQRADLPTTAAPPDPDAVLAEFDEWAAQFALGTDPDDE